MHNIFTVTVKHPRKSLPRCATAFTCPHGYTPWPDTYCDGVVCDDTRDAWVGTW